MTLCILAAGKITAIAASAFTLAWTHSVERTAWEERWRVTPAGLELVEARVKGSGAGMEPADAAVLEDGWWVWRPSAGPQASLTLAASGATSGGWNLCAAGRCMMLGEAAGEPATLSVCEASSGR